MHHRHHHWGPNPRRGGGGFFGRGGVKFAILELLKERPRHGYDIIREMEERSGGLYSPSPGVIYPTLQALEDQDFVKASEQDGKRVYAITESGVAYLEGHNEQMRERWGAAGRTCSEGTEQARPGQAAWSAAGSPEGGRPEAGASGPSTGEAGAGEAGAGEPGSAGDRPGAESTEEDGPGWRFGARGGRAAGGGFGAWFLPTDMADLMKELRWFFGDFAGAMQRTVTDPQKIKEIRQVLREAKHKIDEIVMR